MKYKKDVLSSCMSLQEIVGNVGTHLASSKLEGSYFDNKINRVKRAQCNIMLRMEKEKMMSKDVMDTLKMV